MKPFSVDPFVDYHNLLILKSKVVNLSHKKFNALKNSKVYMMLLGSSISMREETVLFYKAPLYGRRIGQFLISPFSFKEVKKAFSGKEL